MYKPSTWSAGQKDDGNQKMKSVLVRRMWEWSVFQPTQRVSSCLWSPERNFVLMLWHPLCASQPPWPSFHQAHSVPHILVSAMWALRLAGSPQCWIQQLFRSFVLVGVTELMEAERLQEIAVFQQKIKGFLILLHGFSSPYLFQISLSFPRNIAAVEIYL